MVHKCSLLRVLEVFFLEPTTIHFIKGIGKDIDLAPTSVRNHIKRLLKSGLIRRKESKPFDGFVANRENKDFIFYKRAYNLYSLKELKESLVSSYNHPQIVVVYGSYSLGEDVESSDIDVLVLTKVKKEANLKVFEKKMKRKVHLFVVDDLKKLDKGMMKKIWDGMVLHGGF